MYDQHVPIISPAMNDDPRIFARGVMFAILSARQQFTKLPAAVADLAENGEDSRFLFAWKYESFVWLQKHGKAFWAEVTRESSVEGALRRVTEMPGLHLIKGAFVLQLCGHDIACIDSRNAERIGTRFDAYRCAKRSPIFGRKLQQYVAFTRGRAREFWDDWCVDIGQRYNRDPERISAMHVELIVPKDKIKKYELRAAALRANTDEAVISADCPF
jgi:hypothetical protein